MEVGRKKERRRNEKGEEEEGGPESGRGSRRKKSEAKVRSIGEEIEEGARHGARSDGHAHRLCIHPAVINKLSPSSCNQRVPSHLQGGDGRGGR